MPHSTSDGGIRLVELTGDLGDCITAENLIIDLIRNQQDRTGVKEQDLYSNREDER